MDGPAAACDAFFLLQDSFVNPTRCLVVISGHRLLRVDGPAAACDTVNWKETEKDFPGRLSQTLAKRWKELVSKEEVVEERSRNLKRKFKDFDQDDVVLRVKP